MSYIYKLKIYYLFINFSLENFIKNDMSEEEKEFTYIIYFFAKRFMKELIRKGECDENSFFGKMLKISSLDEYTGIIIILKI